LSVRYWNAKPYHKDENGIGQTTIVNLTKDDGVGIQGLGFFDNDTTCPVVRKPDNLQFPFITLDINELSKNDGLSLADFKEWFKGYDLSEPMAIIHFTKFRY
jgi:hypothetical protein